MNEDITKLEDMVAQARAGDMGAFEALYQRHQAGIYMFLRSQVREAELAADLTQQTFVQAWESLARLREPGAFQSWLHRIALNLVRDEAKSGRARLEVVATDLGDERTGAAVGEAAARDPTPEALALSSELRDASYDRNVCGGDRQSDEGEAGDGDVASGARPRGAAEAPGQLRGGGKWLNVSGLKRHSLITWRAA